MPYMLVRHKVQDYSNWKPIFDEHRPARQAAGSMGGRLFRSADDRNELVMLLEWDDMEKAREFARSQDLRDTMKRAGVSDSPDVYFLIEVEQLSA